MLSCPRCHHLNPDGESSCELCGADLGTGQDFSGAGLNETEPLSEPIQAHALADELQHTPPPIPAPVSEPEPEAEAEAEPTAPEGGSLASDLLDALNQEPSEGRARGENRHARGYMVQQLPVPDDMPIPGRGAASLPAEQPSEELPVVEPIEAGTDRVPSGSHAVGQETCPRCSAVNPPNNRFCGGCGSRLPEPDEVASPITSVSSGLNIALVCINEDGSDGTRIALDRAECIIGRETDSRFGEDPFLSPRHARLSVSGGNVTIEDLTSLNGTFVRIRDSVRLRPGDCFLMGRQVLRLEIFEHKINPKATSDDGTRYMGSPIPGGAFKLVQIGIGGSEQNTYCLPAGGAVLGRERGDVTFPGDKFMSARHAQLTTEQGTEVYLTDLNSSNGTWTRISGPHNLRDQDFIFLGQQLFRMQIG